MAAKGNRTKKRAAPKRKSPARKRAPKKAPEDLAPAAEPYVAEPEPQPEPPLDLDIPVESAPEVAFAARTPPPAPERPRPSHRRAIFFDVENTSRPKDVSRMLEHLALDRATSSTELVASGNWRVIGHETARLLAQRGAHLVHSAPATGVRDWSDLRIAVAAGVWLASARPGDVLDIVSDDKAFDVVGDVAATLGVQFRRLSFRKITAAHPLPQQAPSASAAQPAASERPPRSRGGRGRGRGNERRAAQPAPVPAEPSPAPAAEEAAQPSSEAVEGAQPAPHDRVLDVVRELLSRNPSGVNLDMVANRLKALGFQRPPGSPRLVTRLRQFKELDISPRGNIRLRNGASAAPSGEEPASSSDAGAAPAAAGTSRRRRRRGGRGRSRGGSGAQPSGEGETAEAPSSSGEPEPA